MNVFVVLDLVPPDDPNDPEEDEALPDIEGIYAVLEKAKAAAQSHYPLPLVWTHLPPDEESDHDHWFGATSKLVIEEMETAINDGSVLFLIRMFPVQE